MRVDKKILRALLKRNARNAISPKSPQEQPDATSPRKAAENLRLVQTRFMRPRGRKINFALLMQHRQTPRLGTAEPCLAGKQNSPGSVQKFCTQGGSMPQINIHTTPEFERDLLAIMSSMQMFGKSKVIRFAVREVANALRRHESARSQNGGGNAGIDAIFRRAGNLPFRKP